MDPYEREVLGFLHILSKAMLLGIVIPYVLTLIVFVLFCLWDLDRKLYMLIWHICDKLKKGYLWVKNR